MTIFESLPLQCSSTNHCAAVHMACMATRPWRSGVQIQAPACRSTKCIFTE